MYVSITNTEGVMAILTISRSRGGHIGLFFLEIDKWPGPPNTSSDADDHRVQMYDSITNTEGVMVILMISRSRGAHIGILFWKSSGGLVPLSPLATPIVIESKLTSLSQIQKELWPF